eukprot:8248582-Pyramimonas_sp.AAC.1
MALWVRAGLRLDSGALSGFVGPCGSVLSGPLGFRGLPRSVPPGPVGLRRARAGPKGACGENGPQSELAYTCTPYSP